MERRDVGGFDGNGQADLSWKQNKVSQHLNKFPAFYDTRNFIPIFQDPFHSFLL
jgi:hypothetical protein